MYQDNPDWRLYFGLIDSLFVKHPIKIDIAGTIESISKITKDLLYECYETFYHPSNMLMFVVGAIDPEKTMDLIRENQAKRLQNQPEIVRSFEEEPDAVNEKKKIISMPVQTPKCLVGIKATNLKEKGEALLKQEIALTLLLDYLFGKAPFITNLYIMKGSLMIRSRMIIRKRITSVLQWLAAIRSNLMSWKSV